MHLKKKVTQLKAKQMASRGIGMVTTGYTQRNMAMVKIYLLAGRTATDKLPTKSCGLGKLDDLHMIEENKSVRLAQTMICRTFPEGFCAIGDDLNKIHCLPWC